MKFKEWEDFADEINAYGRIGYIKKKADYNPFTGVNRMTMEHRTRHDVVDFVLYPDDESFNSDYRNEAYVRPQSRAEQFLEEMPKQQFTQRIDHRTRENRSDKYPPKPGMTKPESEKQNRPKPHPPKKKD